MEIPASLLKETGSPFVGVVKDEVTEGVWNVAIPWLKETKPIAEAKLTVYTRKRHADGTPKKLDFDDNRVSIPTVTQEESPQVSQPPTTPPVSQPPTTPVTSSSREMTLDEMFNEVQRRSLATQRSEIADVDTPLEDMKFSIRYKGQNVFTKRNQVLKRLGARYTKELNWHAPVDENLAKFDLFRSSSRVRLNNFSGAGFEEKKNFVKDNGAFWDSDERRWFVPGYILNLAPFRSVRGQNLLPPGL